VITVTSKQERYIIFVGPTTRETLANYRVLPVDPKTVVMNEENNLIAKGRQGTIWQTQGFQFFELVGSLAETMNKIDELEKTYKINGVFVPGVGIDMNKSRVNNSPQFDNQRLGIWRLASYEEGTNV